MDSKQLCIERIKFLDNINFVEQIEGKYTIGYIEHYCTDRIKVLYLEDNLGSYVSLLYVMEMKNNCDSVCDNLSRKIVNGRFDISGANIILTSTFPILDPDMTFFNKQLSHALLEIWDMSTVVNTAP